MMTLSEAAHTTHGRLLGRNGRFNSVSIDSRNLLAGGLFVAIVGEQADGHSYIEAARACGAVGALVSRPVDTGLSCIEVNDTTLALGQLAAGWRAQFDIPVAAVTGSNGKTTVTAMLAAIFGGRAACLAPHKSFNNQWGVPLTLLRLDEAHRHAVIEMGTSQHGEIEYLTKMTRPGVALINNVACAHSQGLGSKAEIARAKAEIFSGLQPGGCAVLNADDEFFRFWCDGLAAHDVQIITFALAADAMVSARQIELRPDSSSFVLMIEGQCAEVNLPLPGEHNIRNALAAAAVAHATKIPIADMAQSLSTVRGVAGRLHIATHASGAVLIDDTYNANPASLRAAIDVLSRYPARRILVLGAMAELGAEAMAQHAQVGAYARRKNIDALVCLDACSGGNQGLVAGYKDGYGAAAGIFTGLDDLLDALLPELNPATAILVKGSRSSAMERVLEGLQECSGPAVREANLC